LIYLRTDAKDHNISLHRLSDKQGVCKYNMSKMVSSLPPLSSTSQTSTMPHAKAESSTSAKQGKANKGQASNSTGPIAPQKREKYPPRYGEQHRQDALWEGEWACCETNGSTKYQAGGNDALPPGWTEIKEGDDQRSYWDDTLFMRASDRPLPGVRLGEQRK
jgi:hypothetical protein